MSFMQQQIYESYYFEIETTAGTEIVPADVIGRYALTPVESFLNYLEGTPLDPDGDAQVEHGWLARLSAPGYMDCTDWSAHKTEQEAREYLEEMYGSDDEQD